MNIFRNEELSLNIKKKLEFLVSILGKYLIFTWDSLKGFLRTGLNKNLMTQLEFVGNRSFLIIVLAGAMIGAIFGLQLGDLFRIFGAESMLGAASAYTITKELAPVIGAMLVTGRAGSSMTAEISIMRINEQIDAIKVMGIDPISYLVTPRVVASMFMLPFLTAVFILIGVITSYIMGYLFYNLNLTLYIQKIVWVMRSRDLIQGLEKSMLFGLIYSSICCYKGFFARGGAKGVGVATTTAVVSSFIAILIIDFCVTYIQYKL